MEIHIETAISAPADQVWAVLAHQFASVDNWSSTVERSRPIDAAKVPKRMSVAGEAPVPGRETTSRAGTFVEVLVEYSEIDKEFTFDTAGLPRLLRLAVNRSKVTSTAQEQSVVSFDITVEPAGPLALFAPLLKKRMTKTFGTVQADLKRYVETGEVSR